jgi:hypothetical protein
MEKVGTGLHIAESEICPVLATQVDITVRLFGLDMTRRQDTRSRSLSPGDLKRYELDETDT